MTCTTEELTRRVNLAEAGPDMLEALQRCVQRLEGDWAATREVEMARAAIAKATGGAA